MEGIARLDARFLVDAFDESIMQLDRFYELSRKGRMAEYLADFLQVDLVRSKAVEEAVTADHPIVPFP